MKNILRRIIIDSPLEGLIRKILNKPKIEFKTSPEYWDLRYKANGNSGSGSYGRLAQFKAEVINAFVADNHVQTVIEFGCGDGNQLHLSKYKSYVGVDVSNTAIQICRNQFSKDPTKTFFHSDQYSGEKAELALSLDVIYHLVEDEIFEKYMASLFGAAERHVIIYATDSDDDVYNAAHVRHRRFTGWIEKNASDFKLIRHIPNRYPYSEADPDNTSFADFFIYGRKPI